MIAVTLGIVLESSFLQCGRRLKYSSKVGIAHKRPVHTAQTHHSVQHSVQNFK